jgi:hypothetical protein
LGGGDYYADVKTLVKQSLFVAAGLLAILFYVIIGVQPDVDQSTKYPISSLYLSNGVKVKDERIIFIRFPDCNSCGGTTSNVVNRLPKMGKVIIGMDEQPMFVQQAVKKIPSVSVIKWISLPKEWKRLLPGVYRCNLKEGICWQIEG